MFLILLLVLPSAFGNSKQSCKNVTVSEFNISQWLKENAPLNQWDRPTKNANKPVNVYIKVGMTNFPLIVSCLSLVLFFKTKPFF